MKVYLAGPMSGYTEHNFPAFDSATAELRALGHEVISPAEITRELGMDGHNVDGTITAERYAKCMRADIEALLKVEGIVCLPGWRKSKGAKFEVHLGQLLGLKVVEFPSLQPIRDIVCTDCREPHEIMARAMSIMEGRTP